MLFVNKVDSHNNFKGIGCISKDLSGHNVLTIFKWSEPFFVTSREYTTFFFTMEMIQDRIRIRKQNEKQREKQLVVGSIVPLGAKPLFQGESKKCAKQCAKSDS